MATLTLFQGGQTDPRINRNVPGILQICIAVATFIRTLSISQSEFFSPSSPSSPKRCPKITVYSYIGLLVAIALLWSPSVQASPLVDRLAQFPDWQSKPPVLAAQGDLEYPDWMAGTWTVTSTLVDLVAPLAPELVTPGFEGNRQYLDRPMSFSVRFQPQIPRSRYRSTFPLSTPVADSPPIVADRQFNGTNIARSYLGDKAILSVQVDPDDPNRQITALRGDRQLVSIVSGRSSETPETDRFVATELLNQVFRSSSQIYFNQVESTTAYHKLSPSQVEAEQVTAIYLSSQDPNYFRSGDRPVALYRYRLLLSK